jgi:dTDP-4-dehydrorhamnose 3,5-epimerase
VTTDRLFCGIGRLKVTLYDAREAAPTHRASAVYRIGLERPAVVVVPPGVWHEVRNVGEDTAV